MSDKNQFLHEILKSKVALYSNRVAIKEAGDTPRSVTYSELDKFSDQVASGFRLRGIENRSAVSVIIDSNINFVITILAILKINAIYIPIDISSPTERVRSIVSKSGSSFIISDTCSEQKLLDINLENISIINIKELDYENISVDSIQKLKNSNSTSNIISNISYTSGTTGQPKGVIISHHGMINHVNWRINFYEYTPDDITLIVVSNTMDGFAAILFTSLFSGGTLVLLPTRYRRNFIHINTAIEQYKITNFCIVPSMLQGLMNDTMNLSSVRFITVAGERTDPSIIRNLKKIKPDINIIGEYGAAESTCTTSANKNFNEDTIDHIGATIDNIDVYLLDESLNETDQGEICISGAGISLGYFQDEKLTSQKFINGSKLGKNIVYRTGDLGKKLPDGNIKYIGRVDRQIKLRGIRIEPEGIEKHLLSYPEVKSAVIKEIKGKHGNSIYAYLIPQSPDVEVDIEKLKKFLSEHMPDYCIPSFFVLMNKFPLTVNGKIDIKNLPEVENKYKNLTNNQVESPTQEAIISMFCNFLDNVDKKIVSIKDDFFKLGGNSLSAAMLLAALKKEFGVDLAFDKFKDISTVEKLSNYLIDFKY